MNTPIRLFARQFTLAVSLALAMVGGASAQDAKAGAKVGAVNVERILRDSSTAKAVSAKLEQDFGALFVAPHVSLEAQPLIGFDGVSAFVLQGIGADLVDDADAAPFLLLVDDRAVSFLLD